MTIEQINDSDRIVYCDYSLAVVYKKIGEICESNVNDKSLSLINTVVPILQQTLQSPITYAEAVHRIDQPVSGCVLIALNKKTHSSLSAQFADGKIHKKYLAIVEKSTHNSDVCGGTLEHLITFDTKHHKATALFPNEIKTPGLDWKKAVLDWNILGSGDRYLFLEVEPKTGRTHQIRAQLSHAGMSIKGDLKYGARRSDPLGGIRLHAWKIQFTHPDTNDSITITSPVLHPDVLWQACLGYTT